MNKKNKKSEHFGFNSCVLTGKDAERFILQDHVPLTKEQKEYNKKCYELYLKNPIKWD